MRYIIKQNQYFSYLVAHYIYEQKDKNNYMKEY